MPAPASPAADVSTAGAPNVSTMPANQAVSRRDSRNPSARDGAPNDRARAGRDRLNRIAQEFSAGKFEKGASPIEPETAEATANVDPPEAPATSTPQPKPAKKAEAKAEPTAEEKAASADKAKKIAAAKRALAMDGWEPDDIAALKEDKLLKIGDHRAKNQADVNREFAKLRTSASSPTGARADNGQFAKAEAPADAPAATPAAKQPPAQSKTAEADQTPTGEIDYDQILDAAEDEIGTPAVKLLKSVIGPLTARLKAAEAKVASSGEIGNAVTTEMLYSQGREIIEAEYPDNLSDPAAFDEVAENFKALVASGRYGRGQISKAWRDAGFMSFGAPDTVKQAQRGMLARQKAADVGKVDAGTGDTGAPTTTPITNSREALNLAAKMMVENPKANMDKLRDALMNKVRGNAA